MHKSAHNATTVSIQVLAGLLSTAALLLSAIAYTGQSSTGVKSVYLYKFNLTQVNVERMLGSPASFNSSLDFVTSGLMDEYSIGVSGYCGASGKTTTCHASPGFTITLQSVIKREILSSHTSSAVLREMVLAHGVHVPDELEDTSKDGFAVRPLIIYYSLTAGLAFASIATLLIISGVWFQVYPLYGFGVFASLLSFVAMLVDASVTESYGAIIGSLSDIDVEFGLQGTLGDKIFYVLVWIAISLQFLVLLIPMLEDKVVSLVVMMYMNNNKYLKRRRPMTDVMTVIDTEMGLSDDGKTLDGCEAGSSASTLASRDTMNTLVETVDLGEMIYRCSTASY